MVRLALKYGASREAIDHTTTGDLAEWIEEQEIIREQERDRGIRQQAVDQSRREPVEKPVNDDGIDWGLDEAGVPITEHSIHPPLAKVIKDQQKELRELRKALKTTTEREELRAKVSARERLDEMFVSLPEKLHGLFGSGPVEECTPEELSRRISILRAAGINHTDPPSSKVGARKIADALALFSQEKTAEPEPESPYDKSPEKLALQPNGKPRITPEQFKNGTLAKTTQRNDKEPKNRNSAARAVAEKMREMQLTEADFEAYEEDGMPE